MYAWLECSKGHVGVGWSWRETPPPLCIDGDKVLDLRGWTQFNLPRNILIYP